MNVSANMLRSHFYVCPICGNIIHSVGELAVSCHGVQLQSEIAEEADDKHRVSVQQIEDELYVQVDHEMTKTHYISFIAGVSHDGIQMVKLYPEGTPAARLKRSGVKEIYYYCNKDGLYSVKR